MRAPKRVRAGAAVQVVVRLDATVEQCSLQVRSRDGAAGTTGADRVAFRFRLSRTVRPGRYTLPLRCTGMRTRRLPLTVIAGPGRRGTVRRLVTVGMFTTSIRWAEPPRLPGPARSFRAVYALAADQTETPGHAAAIVATIDAVNGWFGTQTIGNVQPRWMRGASGAPTVTVAKLPRPAAAYERRDGFARVREETRTSRRPAGPAVLGSAPATRAPDQSMYS
ncbi:hypothetical protein DVA67_003310 [Solirubrobacter sp. CPCC 204708]|uniref:Uncharacterized protein n=1 Tax=Solirubrobacter deserti TaxID=2282478 RepID=A0ABT4RMU8_9ACTN|nr:hypothetical protein [Solirubrobacter deserti]MBE2314987.1 hypothetical protein [Solirubrobacter deserti]MDA0139902.1 hypothetical protein [Solirubrobacter deserti]